MLWVFFSGATSICNACAVALRTNEIGHHTKRFWPGPPWNKKWLAGGLVRWHPWTRWAEAG